MYQSTEAAWALPATTPAPAAAPAAAHQLCGWTTDEDHAQWRMYEDHVVSAYDEGGLQAPHSAVENLASQMMDMQYSADTGTEQEEAAPTERSASAPALRSSLDMLLQGLGSPEDERVFMQRKPSSATKARPPLLSNVCESKLRRERRAGGRAEPPSRERCRTNLNRARGHSIAKKPGRRLDRNDPHGRARQADLAAARYSVTTWEDIQRFRVQAAATKARHDAWDAKPIAWDLVLAGSFSAMAAA